MEGLHALSAKSILIYQISEQKVIHLPTENEQFDAHYTHPDKDGHKNQNYISHLSDYVQTLSLGLQGASAESDWETCSRLQVTEGRKEEAVVEESQVASEKKNFKLVSARILQMGGKALLK